MTVEHSASDPLIHRPIFRAVLGVTLVGMLAALGVMLYPGNSSRSLSQVVQDFNEAAKTDSVGRYEPPITEDEIVAEIKSQLPTLDASNEVKAIYSRIADTKHLPPRASLDSISSVSGTGERRTVWWVNLNVMTGPNSGYTLRIRETDLPTVTQ